MAKDGTAKRKPLTPPSKRAAKGLVDLVRSDDEAEAIGRIKGARREKPDKINWVGVREEYVTGTESFADIGRRIGVRKNTVEIHGRADDGSNEGQSWVDRRSDFQRDVSRRFREEAAERQVAEALSVHESQVRHYSDLVALTVPLALAELGSGAVNGVDAVKIAIAVLQAQSKVHGLERGVTQRVELTGKDGGTIEHDIEHGVALDADAAALAERALAALFGAAAEPG